ncbi:hypothetical protein KY348_06195 [Candidatus Woesearchaeota archaeon]|nr:hypothetical protein [Candidatus Woesearchaeota archaeon]
MAFFTFSLPLLSERFSQLVKAPFTNPNMLWIAVPLIITLVMVELYFGKYREEKMGWNTALTNALVLVFVSLNLFQFIFRVEGEMFFKIFFNQAFYIAFSILLLGILLFFIDFFHLIPEALAFTISAHLPINITAYTAIVIVYSNLPLDFATVLAWLSLIIILGVFFFFVKLMLHKDYR